MKKFIEWIAPLMDAEEHNAFNSGKQAFFSGQSIENNPYRIGGYEALFWHRGWITAQKHYPGGGY